MIFRNYQMTKQYGTELILDLTNCNSKLFTRIKLTEFFNKLAKITNMKLALTPYFWDEENGEGLTEPHLIGTSAFHFIQTSNIIVHTLNKLNSVFVNLFTCKTFDIDKACEFIEGFFEGEILNKQVVSRIYNDNSNS